MDEDEGSAADTEGSFACPHCGAFVPEMGMANFSFNKPAGACPRCTGLGVVRQVMIERYIHLEKSLAENAVDGWETFHINYYRQILENSGKWFGFEFDFDKPLKDYTDVQRDLLYYGTESEQFLRHFPGRKTPATNNQGRYEGVITNLLRRYDEHAENEDLPREAGPILHHPDLPGVQRHPAESGKSQRHSDGKDIIEVDKQPLNELDVWLKSLLPYLSAQESLIAKTDTGRSGRTSGPPA